MKNFHPVQMFKHSADLEDGDISCAVVEQALHRLKAGDGDLKSDLVAMALDDEVDHNIRGSILETLAAALIPDCQEELAELLKKILSNEDEDPSVHHVAIGIYEDVDEDIQEILNPLMRAMLIYDDHRSKYVRDKMNLDRYGDPVVDDR